jgi:peptidyl-prolyl cis-trans isomerase B (cyclophilin B)
MMKSWIFLMTAVLSFAAAPATGMENAPKVALETSLGTIVVALDATSAPQTVQNFLSYVDRRFYDNTIFHRVIKSFMIQGGGLTADMQKKRPLPPIKNEADNGLKNLSGTIAMARTADPHSATAQFFINTADNAFLDHKSKTRNGWGYCVFGRVVDGMGVVRAIENVTTGAHKGRRDVPVDPVFIHKVSRIAVAEKGKANTP